MAVGLHGFMTPKTLSILILGLCITRLAGQYRRAPFCVNTEQEGPMSFLWSVNKDPPSYFFGTIHVPYTRVWDHIPASAKHAFQQSDNVFFELDLMDPYTFSALSNCQLLPQGKNLVDVLPKELYRRLKSHLEYVKVMLPSWLTADQRNRGLYADYVFNMMTFNWERKRPVWVMLMVNSLTESDVKSRGIPVLDLYLAQEAEKLNKRTGAVEHPEEQCLPLNGLNFTQVIFALNQTLFQHENIRSGEVQVTYTTEDLIRHYNCGDLNAVIFNHDSTSVPNLVNTSLLSSDISIAKAIDDYFKNELIFKRNKRMAERVSELLNVYPDKSFFFAFGAGHFLGNDTILDFMKSQGYEIEHIGANEKLTHRNYDRKEKYWPWLQVTHTSGFSSDSKLMDTERGNGASSFQTSYQDQPRQRKKGFQSELHRSNVRLLRTTRAPFAKTPRGKFKDLWIRLDAMTTRPPKILPQQEPSNDVQGVEKSLHLWYGFTTSGATIARELEFRQCTLVVLLAWWIY
ncbi:metalloprotease TIKI1-like isoform X1 [Limulus polyphemus]|uniref:Metalloprotease TIKI homolog n=1 Tax=Limulus polyphemus TaxID=6850 RepID=A0ABM1T3A6_LIMPO|nr:metalloprotease TIKI1-like isoform X1 [Limulus polyphemus]